MLQQTTVKAVLPRYELFLRRWPDVEALARRRARRGARRLGRARLLRPRAKSPCLRPRRGGRSMAASFPAARPSCASFRASAVIPRRRSRPSPSAERATPVDGNIERVVARLFAVATPLPDAKSEIRALWPRLSRRTTRAGDFAQAMMDLGATHLHAAPSRLRSLSGAGPIAGAMREGLAEALPYRAEKSERPVRRGVAFVALRADGAVLLRERPLRGLLGGMLETPSSPWDRSEREHRRGNAATPRSKPNGRRCPGWSSTLSRISTRAFGLSRRGRARRRAGARSRARALPLAHAARACPAPRCRQRDAEGLAARPRRDELASACARELRWRAPPRAKRRSA